MNNKKDNQPNGTDLVAKSNKDTSISEVNDNTSGGLLSINVLNKDSIAAAEFYLSKIVASGKSGISSVQDGMAILLRAKDLQIPFSSAVENMHVINGKTGVGVHIIKALLLRAGVLWDKTKDYTPLYYYTDSSNIYEDSIPDYCIRCINKEEALKVSSQGNNVGVYPLQYYRDLGGNIYKETEVTSKCVKCFNMPQAIQLKNEGKFPVIRMQNLPYDYVTEYSFTRVQVVDGEKITRHAISRFSRRDAEQAELIDKDVYKHYDKSMISHRAFTLGAREIADDLLMGVLELTELKKVMGVTVNADDFNEVDELDTIIVESTEE